VSRRAPEQLRPELLRARPSRGRSRLQERTARAVASRRVLPYLAAATVALAVTVGFVVRAIAPNDFHSVGEGIWWAIVTLATVGYGDVVPTTPWGRVLGSIVIVFGVTFLAYLTATVTSLFVSSQQQEAVSQEDERRETSDEETRALLRELITRLDSIEARLDRRAGE
jgi:voltage-gated potassium channel